MNKVLVITLLIAASAAVVMSIPCDTQKGTAICNSRHSECVNNVNSSLSASDKKKVLCKCHYDYSDCLFHFECNGTYMWNLMAICTQEKCEKCPFTVQASSFVFPSVVLVILSAIAVLFM